MTNLLDSPPIPFAPGEGVRRTEAAPLIGRSVRTVDLLAAKYPEIVCRHFSEVYVSRVGLAMIGANDWLALRLYREGDRSSVRVKWYYRAAGIELPAVTGAAE